MGGGSHLLRMSIFALKSGCLKGKTAVLTILILRLGSPYLMSWTLNMTLLLIRKANVIRELSDGLKTQGGNFLPRV